jgi:hypothetical protein
MNIASRSIWSLQSACRLILAVAILASLGDSLAAQQPPAPGPSGPEIQREAMHKLAFLAGHWAGSASISRGPGEPQHLTQAEEVEYKLDGLVLLIQGASRNADGKEVFSALATISFDDATHAYHFRAYNDGHYIDTEVTVSADGFSWGFDAGPVHIQNTMHLTSKGEWAETTDATMGSNPPHRSVDMLLQHQA